MISLKDGIRSLVRIDFSGNVHKQFRGTAARERCENEIRVLRKLESRSCPYVPRLLESYPEEHYIVTTNCGKTAESTISRAKADTLYQELEEVFGIRHDDPEPRNITYDAKLGRFCIIDFELAEILDNPMKGGPEVEGAPRLSWASDTKQGRRHLTNQDSHLSCTLQRKQHFHKAPFGEIILPCTFSAFWICDGVGGNNGGEFASKYILNSLLYYLESRTHPPLTLETFVSNLREIHTGLNETAKLNSHAASLGAAFVGMIIQGDKIMWANVGDSRLYRLRDGALEQLSNDHNFAFRQWKRGEISEMQFRTHPRKNILFDSMGGGHANINPETGEDTWQLGDRYLLCSDGIVDGLADSKIQYLLKQEGDTDRTETAVQVITKSLLREATSNAGNDDTTLIVVDLT